MKKTQLKAKEPVKIRFRKIANGNQSIYFDIYRDGKRSYHYPKLYLVPEKTAFDKAQNANTIQAAQCIKADLIKQIANGEAGIKDDGKVLFSEYWENCLNRKKNITEGTKRVYKYVLRYILKFRGEVKLKDIDEKYCTAFFGFLCGIMQPTTAKTYADLLNSILNFAYKDGLIQYNPISKIDKSEKIKAETPERDFLTIEELKRFIEVETRSKLDTKNAFLFSCFTGLRWSDVKKLVWSDIIIDENGTVRIKGKTKKTKTLFYNSIPAEAVKCLPERKNKAETDAVFNITSNAIANYSVKMLAKKAGINKNVSFHTARHTFATMLLTQGADLYTVSKLLGHSNLATTEIYAKIIDKKKDEAMNLLNDIF